MTTYRPPGQYTVPDQYKQQGAAASDAPPKQRMVLGMEAGLFSCTDDCCLCLKGFCCLPCLTAENSAALDGQPNNVCLFCFYPVGNLASAGKVRAQAKAKLHAGAYKPNDCLIDAFCTPCSMIQVAHEIQNKKMFKAYELGGAPRKPEEYGTWSSRLCHDDFTCDACKCPCRVNAETSSKLDGHPEAVCCGCCYPMCVWTCCGAKQRAQCKVKYGLPPFGCKDCLIVTLCCCFSVAQVKREIRVRSREGRVRSYEARAVNNSAELYEPFQSGNAQFGAVQPEFPVMISADPADHDDDSAQPMQQQQQQQQQYAQHGQVALQQMPQHTMPPQPMQQPMQQTTTNQQTYSNYKVPDNYKQ